MENKNLKDPMLNALDDDTLDNASGGAVADTYPCPGCKKIISCHDQFCPYCGKIIVILQPWFH